MHEASRFPRYEALEAPEAIIKSLHSTIDNRLSTIDARMPRAVIVVSANNCPRHSRLSFKLRLSTAGLSISDKRRTAY